MLPSAARAIISNAESAIFRFSSPGDVPEPFFYLMCRDSPERQMLTTRNTVAGIFFGLGSSKNKDDMGRRLLERLQQGIESSRRKHVGLINDINLISASVRRIAYPFPQVAYIVNSGIGSAIDFGNIHRRTVGYRTGMNGHLPQGSVVGP